MRHRLMIMAALFAAIALPAAAYKEVVHRAITEQAWARAVSNLDLQHHLGIDPQVKIAGRTPQQWAEQGADDEDSGLRSLSHFYDPRHDKPLTAQPFCTAVGDTAPDRALAATPLSDASIGAVNNAYLFAITGATEADRSGAAKRLFLTLGHTVHLLEDMAQPEHTRNDQHLFPLFATAPASIYEEWGLLHLIGSAPDIAYGGYPTMTFPRYRDYWHTDDSAMGFPIGHGMADFANNNFLTQDTNYSDTTGKCFYYDLPSLPLNASAVRTEITLEQVWIAGVQAVIPVESDIYTSSITDYARNLSESDPFHTFYSSLDHETRLLGVHVYSLGDGSYTTRASMLIPRAVGYSAGLMERVFRGQIGVVWKATPNQPGKYDMEITNKSAEAIGSDARLFSFYKHEDPPGSGFDLQAISTGKLSDLISGFSGIPAGGSVTIEGIQPAAALPAGRTLDDFEKHVAIEGMLGTGDAVIGLVQPPSGNPLFVRIQTFRQAYQGTPPPMPPSTQLSIYVAAPGATAPTRVDGTRSADGQSITASTRIPAGSSYRILANHVSPGQYNFLISAAEDKQYIDDPFSPHFIDEYGLGLNGGQYGVSQCLPLDVNAPAFMTPPGYLITPQYRGACGVQFYLVNPFEP